MRLLSGRQSGVDPRRYGPPHPRLGPVRQERDETNWRLLEGAGAYRIEEGTILARSAGETMTEVHSFPHQAVKAVGRDRIAWSEDGIIGALPQADLFLLSGVSRTHVRFGRASRAIVKHFRQHAAKPCERTRGRA